MKLDQEESLDREGDPNGLLLQPTFGKAVGSSPYHQVEGNQHRVRSLAGGGQQPSAVQRPDGIEAHGTGKPVASDDKMTAETIAATRPQYTPTVSPTEPVEAGKGGEGGDFQITNAEFIAAVFTDLPEGAFAAVCSKSGDPSLGGWSASRADQVANSLAAENNNYVNCSSFYPGDDGSFKARKAQFSECHFFLLDDLGTKVQ